MDGLPTLSHLTSLDFVHNTSFFGRLKEEFESHMTGVDSILQRDVDANAYQELIEEDDGSREIFSRGLALLNGDGASSYIDLKRPVAISEVACRLVLKLTKLSDPFVQATIDYLQDSFTTRRQRKLIAGPIGIRRELLVASVVLVPSNTPKLWNTCERLSPKIYVH